MIWTGYDCSVKFLNDGFFLNVDTSTKFVSMTTIYDKINELKSERYSQEEITYTLVPRPDPNNPDDKKLKRLVVITKYNSLSYQIDDLIWNLTPASYQFEWTQKDFSNPTAPVKT